MNKQARRRQNAVPHFLSLLALTALTLGNPIDALSAETAVSLPALSAELQDEVHEYQASGTSKLRWQTFWVVNWKVPPGVKDYEVRYKTSEGLSRIPKFIAGPPFRLEVAKGDNLKSQDLLARTDQLETIKSLLSIQITPRYHDGTRGQFTQWLQVGAPYTTQ